MRSLIITATAILLNLYSFHGVKAQELDTVRIDTTQIVTDFHPQDLEKKIVDIQIRGYVKVNAHIDFNGMGSTEGFIPYTIPIDSTINVRNNGAYIGARQSRIGFRSEIHSQYGTIETYIEGDFAEPTANVFRFRLRHAYGKIGYWTIGHTWTIFMDMNDWSRI